MYAYVYIYVCMYVCMFVCMFVCGCLYVCLYICAYIHIRLGLCGLSSVSRFHLGFNTVQGSRIERIRKVSGDL